MVDYADKQTEMSNTRIPYKSTLIQLENDPIEVRGAKKSMENAQDLVDYGDKQTDTSNARIPYASTLVQIEGGPERFTYGMEPEEGNDF
jgi:hypothetical protein